MVIWKLKRLSNSPSFTEYPFTNLSEHCSFFVQIIYLK